MIDLRRLPRRLKSFITSEGPAPYLLDIERARALVSQLSYAIRHGHASRREKAEMAELLEILRTKLRTADRKARKAELREYEGRKVDADLEAEGMRNWIRGSSGRRLGEL